MSTIGQDGPLQGERVVQRIFEIGSPTPHIIGGDPGNAVQALAPLQGQVLTAEKRDWAVTAAMWLWNGDPCSAEHLLADEIATALRGCGQGAECIAALVWRGHRDRMPQNWERDGLGDDLVYQRHLHIQSETITQPLFELGVAPKQWAKRFRQHIVVPVVEEFRLWAMKEEQRGAAVTAIPWFGANVAAGFVSYTGGVDLCWGKL